MGVERPARQCPGAAAVRPAGTQLQQDERLGRVGANQQQAGGAVDPPVALPAVAAPMVRPLRVMVKAVVAAMPTTAVVMTMELEEKADVAVMLLTDVLPAALAAGLGVAAKNPGG